jgi:peptide/nickel transport system substrate-binding protein
MNLSSYLTSRVVVLGVLMGALALASTAPVTSFGQGSAAVDNPLVVAASSMPDGLGTSGGTLIMDNISDPQTFNPITARDDGSDAILKLINAGLMSRDGSVAVAESFNISPDETSVTFTIRKGIKFSDGTPVTAEDVRFTLQDVIFNSNVNSSKQAWLLNGQFPNVQVINDNTVKISSTVPFQGLLSNLADTPILPKHLLSNSVQSFNQAWSIVTPLSQIAGVGPFVIKSYTPGQQVVLARNPYYWKTDSLGVQLPYLDQIILPITTNDDVRLLRFLNGQTDIYPPRPQDLQSIRDKAADGFNVVVQPAGTSDSNVFSFNQDAADPNLQKLFRDQRFRQAMSYAADRASMISTGLDGLGEPRYGPGISSEFFIGDDADFPQYAFDMSKARQLLDQIGLTDSNGDGVREFPSSYPQPGAPVQFELLTVQDSSVLINDATIYAQALKSLGINVTVTPVAFNTLVTRLLNSKTPQYQVARITISFSGDPDYLGDIYAASGTLHFWKYSDAQGQSVPDWQNQVQQLLTQQAVESDPSKRFDELKQFQQVVAQHVPLVYLYNAQAMQANRKDRIGNFSGTERSVTLLNPDYIFHK